MAGTDDVARFTFLSSNKAHVALIVRRGKQVLRVESNRRQVTGEYLKAAPALKIGDEITTGPDTYASLEFVIGGRVLIKSGATVIIDGERSVQRKLESVSAERWRAVKGLTWYAMSQAAPGTAILSGMGLVEHAELGFMIDYALYPEVTLPIAAGVLILSVAVMSQTPAYKPPRQGPFIREGFSPGAIRG